MTSDRNPVFRGHVISTESATLEAGNNVADESRTSHRLLYSRKRICLGIVTADTTYLATLTFGRTRALGLCHALHASVSDHARHQS